MTVLVTGGAGFLGGHVVDIMVERAEPVRILVRAGEDISRFANMNVEIRQGDLTDRSSLESAVAGVERVLHCAARTGPWGPEAEYERINVFGTKMLVESAMAAGVRRIVHVSSITVHGLDVRGTVDETAPLQGGFDPYSRTKAATERVLQQMIRDKGAPVTIVRPGLIYGPRDSNSFGRFASLVKQGKMVIIGAGTNHLPLIYVRDVAQGIVLASEVEQAIGNAYLLVNDEPVTQQGYFRTIAKELGVAPPRIHIPYRAALAIGGTAELVGHALHRQQPPPLMRFGLMQLGGENRFKIDRARSELGFSPQVNLTEGVHQSIDWYRSQSSK